MTGSGAVVSEVLKILSLPVARVTMLGTVIGSAVLGGSFGGQLGATGGVIASVVYVYAGLVVLGAHVTGSEYAGSQVSTTLLGVPRRGRLVTAKVISLGVVALATSTSALAAGALSASASASASASSGVELGVIAGAIVYLTSLGLISGAFAFLFRASIPALVVMLVLAYILSPLLVSLTELAAWLPDRAGRLLYAPDAEPGWSAAAGGIVLLAWVAVVWGAAALRFARRDA